MIATAMPETQPLHENAEIRARLEESEEALRAIRSKTAFLSPTDKPRRMLIVDDNVDAAEGMAMLQQLRGHETRTAHTGPAAVELASAFMPDVVLLDIGLPGMDGYQVARRVRAMPGMEKAFLVAMTGYGSDEDRRRAKEAGFDEHMTKPADLDLLRKWLRARS